MRNMMLCDLHFNNTHSLRQGEADFAGMIGLVYQKMVHKERNKAKHVVGCWRHRVLQQCFTSMISMAVFIRHRSDPELHFHRPLLTDRADWWNIPLISWASENAAGKAYREIFNELGVNPEKCTHLRRAGTEYASAQGGLSACVIGTMTKHRARNQSTLEQSYNTELHREVLECMAGFPKWRGSYDVPRTRIPVKEWWPGGIDFIVSRLFPNHQEWISQAVHEYEGDGSDAAMN
jgi:hypothetical protein